MVEIQIPYGETKISYEIEDANLWEIVNAKNEPSGLSDSNAQITIRESVKNPIGCPKLSKLIEPDSRILITHDDHTRGTPGHIILPPFLESLNQCGVPDENITLIFAVGMHRAVKSEEMVKLLGNEVVQRIDCINHNCDAQDLVRLGTTSRQNNIEINPIATEVDHIIGTGKCGYHYYAGFSGGRKTILPGICGRESINSNHAFMIDDRAVTGNLSGNPVHEDMVEAAKMSKLLFIVNIVQNTNKEIIRIFAGDPIQAHLCATEYYDEMYRIRVKGLADIVIVGAGYPSDINLYQGYKAIDNAKMIVRPGGVIIAALECREGHGEQIFYEWAKKFRTLKELEEQITTNFEMGGHKAYHFAKIQAKTKIILVSRMNPKELREIFLLEPAKTLEDAMNLAYNSVGRDVKISVMPNGLVNRPII